jgi:hypothetical protein
MIVIGPDETDFGRPDLMVDAILGSRVGARFSSSSPNSAYLLRSRNWEHEADDNTIAERCQII